jgi:hypothetical protein
VLASLSAIADDVSRVGLDAADVRKVADIAAEHHKVLDEITESRLLTGDLWTVHQASHLSRSKLSLLESAAGRPPPQLSTELAPRPCLNRLTTLSLGAPSHAESELNGSAAV